MSDIYDVPGLTDSDLTEIECLLSFICDDAAPPFDTRVWAFLAERAFGKAARVEDGEYGPSDSEVDTAVWAAQLRSISTKIRKHLRSRK